MSNPFESFALLPDELQKEALREGELRLGAQLQVATAADQRALTWGGLLVAAATGALGGGLALIGKSDPDYLLGSIAILFAACMMAAAWKALVTVQPGQFCLPGNRPVNWLPAEWDCTGSDRRKTHNARMDQAEQLSRHIAENAENARRRAAFMSTSFKMALRTMQAGGIALAAVLVFRVVQNLDIGISWPEVGCPAIEVPKSKQPQQKPPPKQG